MQHSDFFVATCTASKTAAQEGFTETSLAFLRVACDLCPESASKARELADELEKQATLNTNASA